MIFVPTAATQLVKRRFGFIILPVTARAATHKRVRNPPLPVYPCELSKLEGIFTPLLVPLDERGQINEGELRRFVSWLIERGVHGLYPNGSTGEFTRFTAEERRRIVEVVVDQAGGRVPILAGAAEANVKETLAACEAYARMGVRAVAIVAPFYYKLTPESVYAYFAEIARHSPIDLTLYNIPMFASPIDVPTIRRLAAEFPRVIGIKDSSGDLAFMMRMIAAVRPLRADFSFLTGWEAVLVPMLMIGCDGGTHASSNAVPEVTRRLYDLCRAGDFTEAMKWQFRILELFDVMLYPFEFPDGFRAAAELRGFSFGRGRQPQTSAQRSGREALSSVLRCILADFELVVPPAGGCPARIGEAGHDKLEQVVFEVMQELERKGVLRSKGQG
jgi:dihydrodipicolinate synthase/N-acetylneuraminate lyase